MATANSQYVLNEWLKQLMETKYIGPTPWHKSFFKNLCARIITFLLLQDNNWKQSITKRIQGRWQTHGHYSVAFQSRNFMQDISLHYHKWQVSTHLPIWKNWLHHFMLNGIKRLRWMSIVLLQKMKSLIERCFASQRSLNLQFVESLILFKENLQQTSATKAGF